MSASDFPRKLAREIREAFPTCQAGDVLKMFGHDDCTGWTEHLHHRRTKGQLGGGVEGNALAVCHACHAWIHANPKLSHDLTFLVREGDREWHDLGRGK